MYERWAAYKASGSVGFVAVSDHEGALHTLSVTSAPSGGSIRLYDAAATVLATASIADIQIPAGTAPFSLIFDVDILYGLVYQTVSFVGVVTITYK